MAFDKNIKARLIILLLGAATSFSIFVSDAEILEQLGPRIFIAHGVLLSACFLPVKYLPFKYFAGAAMLAVGFLGGAGLIVAAPLLVAAGLLHYDLKAGRPTKWVTLLGASGTAFILALLFFRASYEKDAPNDSTPNEATATPATPVEDPGFPWIILVVLVAFLLAVVLFLFLRRRAKNKQASAGKASFVKRFEKVGRKSSHRRKPHQGLLSYGDDLTQSTGDERLGRAGNAVSESLYDPGSHTESNVEEALSALETESPPKAKKPFFKRWLKRS